MTTSESINELATALAKAQGEMAGAKKDSANPFFKSKYPDLASVRDACAPALSKHGIAVVQDPMAAGAVVSVETTLMHSSGQWVRGSATAVAKDDSPQSIGSTITYLRRYALMSFAGIAPEDDDAEAAQGRGNGKSAQSIHTAIVTPEGYTPWLKSFTAVVEQGIEALRRVWNDSPSVYRDHLMATDLKRWEGMKAAAQAVTDTKNAKAAKADRVSA